MTFTQILKPLAMGLLLVSAIGCVKGPKGEPGVPGAGKIISALNCGGTISGVAGSASVLNGLEIEYDAVLTSGGDVYATAVIVDESYQASGTAFYAADQAGAQNALVLVTADYHNTSDSALWKISLDRATLITRIVYDDSSLGSPVEMTFNSAACTVQYF